MGKFEVNWLPNLGQKHIKMILKGGSSRPGFVTTHYREKRNSRSTLPKQTPLQNISRKSKRLYLIMGLLELGTADALHFHGSNPRGLSSSAWRMTGRKNPSCFPTTGDRAKPWITFFCNIGKKQKKQRSCESPVRSTALSLEDLNNVPSSLMFDHYAMF